MQDQAAKVLVTSWYEVKSLDVRGDLEITMGQSIFVAWCLGIGRVSASASGEAKSFWRDGMRSSTYEAYKAAS